jgi:hypothetical protein
MTKQKACKKRSLSLERLFFIFSHTAKDKSQKNDSFLQSLSLAVAFDFADKQQVRL